VTLHETPLFKRMIALAKRLAALCDELIGARGELVEIAESYAEERKLCIRCGHALDRDLRCPECDKREADEDL